MELYADRDSFLFFSAIALGFCLGLYYEVFRFLRLSFPNPKVLIFFEDLLFFLTVTPIFIFFHYALSDGVIRWFSFLGGIGGFLLYLGTLGRLILFFSSSILRMIKAIFKWIIRIFFVPVFIVFKKITNCLFTRGKNLVIIVRKRRSARRLIRQKKVLLQRAKKGFTN